MVQTWAKPFSSLEDVSLRTMPRRLRVFRLGSLYHASNLSTSSRKSARPVKLKKPYFKCKSAFKHFAVRQSTPRGGEAPKSSCHARWFRASSLPSMARNSCAAAVLASACSEARATVSWTHTAQSSTASGVSATSSPSTTCVRQAPCRAWETCSG